MSRYSKSLVFGYVLFPLGGAFFGFLSVNVSKVFLVGFFLWAAVISALLDRIKCPRCRWPITKSKFWICGHLFCVDTCIPKRTCPECGESHLKIGKGEKDKEETGSDKEETGSGDKKEK